MQLMCSDTSLGCCCCVVFIENAEVVWCDSVSEDPGRQWTRSRSYLTRHYGQSHIWLSEEGSEEAQRGINTVYVSPALSLHLFFPFPLWLACWIGPFEMHLALYFRLLNGLHLLAKICGVVCRQLYLHSMLSILSLCTLVLCIWISMGTACTKQHNSMPAGSPGDVCPSALWRVTSGMERRQNVDPLVSFWWHLYYLFVTLDREPKETAREEKAVCLLLYLYVCACMYMCVCVKRGKGEREQRGQNSLWYWSQYGEKQRLRKDELDMTRRK